VAQVTLPPSKYPNEARRAAFVREAVQRLEAQPGVTSAALSQSVPIGFTILSPVLAEGQGFLPLPQRPLVQWNMVSPGYFCTHGIALVSGRDFTWADDERAPKVVMINQALACYFWPKENALVKHLTFTRLQVPFEVVGVVGDTRGGNLEREPQMILYSVYAQCTRAGMAVSVRTTGNPVSLAKVLAGQIAAVDRDLAVSNVQTMDEVVAGALSERQETMYLVAAFAGLALVLAVIGPYGVMSFSVAQRTAEIGIRQAIGAQQGDILRMVMGQGLRLSLAGIVLGSLAGAGATRLITRMLFRVSATDPATFLLVAGVFLVVSLTACYIPAWRAMRVDPLLALRGR
jgi:putative ABC transport system permease protein